MYPRCQELVRVSSKRFFFRFQIFLVIRVLLAKTMVVSQYQMGCTFLFFLCKCNYFLPLVGCQCCCRED